MTVLIPAYEPSEKLIDLVNEITALCHADIVIVDDGSGEKYADVFAALRSLGITVLTHEVNRGKGEALKTGFSYIQSAGRETECIVTADCDGQHLPTDILRVGESAKQNPARLVMGCRHFADSVPFRNRFGNLITVFIFRLATGIKVSDTQTGLRGFSPDMLSWLCKITGSRFEYEQKMLLETNGAGYPVIELPIETIYDEKNYSTHYRPFADSVRVLMPILKYSSVSILSFFIDYVLFLVFNCFLPLFQSVLFARVASATFNFSLNKFVVFTDSKQKTAVTFLKYALLAIVLIGLSTLFISFLSGFCYIPEAVAKPVSDVILYCASYWIQRKYIFPQKRR